LSLVPGTLQWRVQRLHREDPVDPRTGTVRDPDALASPTIRLA
jgi:hypothetical protein